VARYIATRLLGAVFLVWVVTTLTFFLIHSAPGLPTIAASLDQTALDRDRTIRELGLDQPLIVQYWSWLSSAARGDFGNSLTYRGVGVMSLVGPALGPTLLLSVVAFTAAILLAIPLGITAAAHRGSRIDYAVNLVSALGLALPGFWLGLLLIIVFGIQLRVLPTSGYSSSSGEDALDVLAHLVLPATVLVAGILPQIARQMRSSMLDELQQDYLRTARSKGLAERTIVYRHALKNSLFPVVTLIGLQIPILVGGAAVVESLFAWPGMGRLAVNSALQRDYPTVLGVTTVVATLAIVSSLVVDLLYGWLDPRVRIEPHRA
jgi:peptide/nickel transport system permease protein